MAVHWYLSHRITRQVQSLRIAITITVGITSIMTMMMTTSPPPKIRLDDDNAVQSKGNLQKKTQIRTKIQTNFGYSDPWCFLGRFTTYEVTYT